MIAAADTGCIDEPAVDPKAICATSKKRQT
jgi:hypothetical protein